MGRVKKGKLGTVRYQLIQWTERWTLGMSDKFGVKSVEQGDGRIDAFLLLMLIDEDVQYSQGVTARN